MATNKRIRRKKKLRRDRRARAFYDMILELVKADFRRYSQEDSIYRKILPPVAVPPPKGYATWAEFNEACRQGKEIDLSVPTDKPVKVVDTEPDSPAAISLPFGVLPSTYITNTRFKDAHGHQQANPPQEEGPVRGEGGGGAGPA